MQLQPKALALHYLHDPPNQADRDAGNRHHGQEIFLCMGVTLAVYDQKHYRVGQDILQPLVAVGERPVDKSARCRCQNEPQYSQLDRRRPLEAELPFRNGTRDADEYE